MKFLLPILAAAALAGTLWLAGCVHRSGGTWMVRSAALPEGWPDLTPVGEVHVREYPAYRAATVRSAAGGDETDPMFMELFRHIKRNGIAMTAPVDMGYQPTAGGPRMATMAFLYRSPSLGQTGEDGPVRVEDLPPATYASVGVRGDYTRQNFEAALHLLESWLATSEEWKANGPPRYLGYNGPFVPGFMRFGEVQVPVTRRESAG